MSQEGGQDVLWIVLGALVIGLTLGLLGSGGSILTLPVLVYLLGHTQKVAIAESLGIVCGIALSAAIRFALARSIDWRCVLSFGLPAMVATYFSSWMSKYVPGAAQMTMFAAVMLVAAWLMFRGPVKPAHNKEPEEGATDAKHKADVGENRRKSPAVWIVILEGVAVGLLTGLVGVGGGFLIVPALVLVLGLPMRLAVGTSLAIVALNSGSGFLKHLAVLENLRTSTGDANLHVDWGTIGWFFLVGVVGSLVGTNIGRRIEQQALKTCFAVFLVVMGIFVLAKELPQVVEDVASAPTASSK